MGRRPLRTSVFVAAAFICAAAAVFFLLAHAAKPRRGDAPIRDTETLIQAVASGKLVPDLAEANLLCGAGLPGTESVDVQAALDLVGRWSAHVDRETERNLHRFRRDPASFSNSEAYFRALMLVTVLEQDYGVSYDLEVVESGVMDDLGSTAFFRDASNLFIHGLLSDRRRGSCSSMPVLVASVGRRLGYPLKLVRSKGHLFVRWEGSGERFNMDNAGKGLVVQPDEHYRKWPFPATDEEIEAGLYLASLTPAQEWACFLELRGVCLLEAGRNQEAAASLEAALGLWPELRECRMLLGRAQHRVANATGGGK